MSHMSVYTTQVGRGVTVIIQRARQNIKKSLDRPRMTFFVLFNELTSYKTVTTTAFL